MQELLQHLNKIHRLSPKAEQALLAICASLSVPKNKDLHPIGHTCRNIYFVKKGLLRIYYFKDGRDITESFQMENALVARADSLFDAKPSQKGIQAIEDSELVAINSAKLFALYDEHHDMERLFRKIYEQAYVSTVERIENIQFFTAEQRYQKLKENYADVLLRIPLKYVASYLGISQVSLSRIRSRKPGFSPLSKTDFSPLKK